VEAAGDDERADREGERADRDGERADRDGERADGDSERAADRFGKRVLVEVKSSSEMQEVALRKQELLRRLRKVRGFENVVDVRFSVNG
jgi:hypothetical protein